MEVLMARAKKGQAIRESQRTEEKLDTLKEFIQEAEALSDLWTWRRGRAVLGYVHGRPAAQLAVELDVSLAAVKSGFVGTTLLGCKGCGHGMRQGQRCA